MYIWKKHIYYFAFDFDHHLVILLLFTWNFYAALPSSILDFLFDLQMYETSLFSHSDADEEHTNLQVDSDSVIQISAVLSLLNSPR